MYATRNKQAKTYIIVKKTIIIICQLVIAVSAYTQSFYQVSSSYVAFTSDAPLELIEAECTELQGILKPDERTFAFRAPMAKFEGFNSALQKTHFNANYLETAKYAYTKFEGKIIEEVDFDTPGTYSVRGKGRFTCHGVVQERIIKCKLIVKPDGCSVKSEFTVLLDDHNIKIPSVVNQRIAEEIVVELELDLNKR